MYARILVPVDGSPTAAGGLDEAIALTRLSGGRLRLLHAVDDLSKATDIAGEVVHGFDLFEKHRVTGRAILAAALAHAARGGICADAVMVEYSLRTVADVVVEHATAWPADLVVLGTHGRQGVDRLLCGSDAEQVVRTSPVPVLLVRVDAASKAPEPTLDAAKEAA